MTRPTFAAAAGIGVAISPWIHWFRMQQLDPVERDRRRDRHRRRGHRHRRAVSGTGQGRQRDRHRRRHGRGTDAPDVREPGARRRDRL